MLESLRSPEITQYRPGSEGDVLERELVDRRLELLQACKGDARQAAQVFLNHHEHDRKTLLYTEGINPKLWWQKTCVGFDLMMQLRNTAGPGVDILLTQIGGFYETAGVSAVLLFEHSSFVSRMKGEVNASVARLAVPQINSTATCGFNKNSLQKVVDQLCAKDLIVAVAQEVGDDEASKRKIRRIVKICCKGDTHCPSESLDDEEGSAFTEALSLGVHRNLMGGVDLLSYGHISGDATLYENLTDTQLEDRLGGTKREGEVLVLSAGPADSGLANRLRSWSVGARVRSGHAGVGDSLDRLKEAFLRLVDHARADRAIDPAAVVWRQPDLAGMVTIPPSTLQQVGVDAGLRGVRGQYGLVSEALPEEGCPPESAGVLRKLLESPPPVATRDAVQRVLATIMRSTSCDLPVAPRAVRDVRLCRALAAGGAPPKKQLFQDLRGVLLTVLETFREAPALGPDIAALGIHLAGAPPLSSAALMAAADRAVSEIEAVVDTGQSDSTDGLEYDWQLPRDAGVMDFCAHNEAAWRGALLPSESAETEASFQRVRWAKQRMVTEMGRVHRGMLEAGERPGAGSGESEDSVPSSFKPPRYRSKFSKASNTLLLERPIPATKEGRAFTAVIEAAAESEYDITLLEVRGNQGSSNTKAKLGSDTATSRRRTTSELVDAQLEYIEACEHLVLAMYIRFQKLAAQLATRRTELRAINQMCQGLYMLLNHAEWALSRGWKLPQLVGSAEQHPLLLRGLHPYWLPPDGAGTVANDLDVGGLMILTGANMGGKSTLLRSVLASCLLANCGLAAPVAAHSSVPHFSQYHYCTFEGDAASQGVSSFHMEVIAMRKMHASLQQGASARGALVLLDEFGRGTSNTSGGAAAVSHLEELHEVGCKTVFATHLHEIRRLHFSPGRSVLQWLEGDGVGIKHVEVLGDGSRTFLLKDGWDSESCALQVAKEVLDPSLHHLLGKVELAKQLLRPGGTPGAPLPDVEPSHPRLVPGEPQPPPGDDPVEQLAPSGDLVEERPAGEDPSPQPDPLPCVTAMLLEAANAVLLTRSPESHPFAEEDCRVCRATKRVPPQHVRADVVYVLVWDESAARPTFYVGRTNKLMARRGEHAARPELGKRYGAFTTVYLPVGGRSVGGSFSNEIETCLLKAMLRAGMHLASAGDARRKGFGT